MGRMLDKLSEYYKRKGIHSEYFRCRHCKFCKGGARECWTPKQLERNFTEATSAYAGAEYERGRLPRLLFVSLDPGRLEEEDRAPDARTPKGVRHRVMRDDIGGNSVHWVWTHEVAVAILAGHGDRRIDDLQRSGRIYQKKVSREQRLKDLKIVTPCFAHVNSAKCCLNLPGNQQAPSILYENCREYLKEEIEVLRPQIIVTQGLKAFEGLRESFDKASEAAGSQAWYDCTARNLRLEGVGRVLWLSTYHPNYPRKQNEWEEYWKKCLYACGRQNIDRLLR